MQEAWIDKNKTHSLSGSRTVLKNHGSVDVKHPDSVVPRLSPAFCSCCLTDRLMRGVDRHKQVLALTVSVVIQRPCTATCKNTHTKNPESDPEHDKSRCRFTVWQDSRTEVTAVRKQLHLVGPACVLRQHEANRSAAVKLNQGSGIDQGKFGILGTFTDALQSGQRSD